MNRINEVVLFTSIGDKSGGVGGDATHAILRAEKSHLSREKHLHEWTRRKCITLCRDAEERKELLKHTKLNAIAGPD